jgi:hypothetical protein
VKEFEAVELDPDKCGEELAELGRLLAAKHELSERKDVLPLFREHRQLSAFLASYHPDIRGRERLIGYEYNLFGDFGADAVIGDRARNAFCMVEFEDATPRSVFRRSGRSLPGWSSRFQSGFSQIVDWFWKLSELQHTPDFARRFGGPFGNFMGVLVVGRSADLAPQELARLRWFRHNVLVNSKRVYCCTFDELYSDLLERLEVTRTPAADRPNADDRPSASP